jgi:predicted HicB family RNase H-like nuclease
MQNVSDLAPFGVRLQPELKEWLKISAKQNQRSMNNELVFILENEKARRASTQQALIT